MRSRFSLDLASYHSRGVRRESAKEPLFRLLSLSAVVSTMAKEGRKLCTFRRKCSLALVDLGALLCVEGDKFGLFTDQEFFGICSEASLMFYFLEKMVDVEGQSNPLKSLREPSHYFVSIFKFAG